VVLGDLLDKNLLRGLTLSNGDLTPFFTRPISAVLFAMTALAALWAVPGLIGRLTRPFTRRAEAG
jgi:putative tricarboxylic transport membrane protein